MWRPTFALLLALNNRKIPPKIKKINSCSKEISSKSRQQKGENPA
jgi:hypothetical protein